MEVSGCHLSVLMLWANFCLNIQSLSITVFKGYEHGGDDIDLSFAFGSVSLEDSLNSPAPHLPHLRILSLWGITLATFGHCQGLDLQT